MSVAKNDQQEALEKALSASLTRVIDQQKFAETKNGALIAFDTAWTVAIANLLSKADGVPAGYENVLRYAATLFLLSAFVALISFLPRRKLDLFYPRRDRPGRDYNLIFFGDIVRCDLSEVGDLMAARYLPKGDASASPEYLADLSNQICVNSHIASRKFTLFIRAAALAFIGMGFVAYPAMKSTLGGAWAWLWSI
jgi:hypothetical protein